jgi:hypothetical protein
MLQPQLKSRVRQGAYVLDLNKIAEAVLVRVQRISTPAITRSADSRRALARRDGRQG